MKKVIIAGTRNFGNYQLLYETMTRLYAEPIEVVCGCAQGADSLGKKWAEEKNYPVKLIKPKWEQQGIVAGFNRNVEMADYADEAVVFWDGQSKGSEHMIKIMKNIQKKVEIIKYKEK